MKEDNKIAIDITLHNWTDYDNNIVISALNCFLGRTIKARMEVQQRLSSEEYKDFPASLEAVCIERDEILLESLNKQEEQLEMLIEMFQAKEKSFKNK